MTVADWYNSEPMQAVRKQITGNTPLSLCASCYSEESNGYESRRIRENYKSVIFTKTNFEKSYQQSHWHNRFENTVSDLPIDWHVDLGNECNLACKMCNPQASSLIADRYKHWLIDIERRSNWTNNPQAWVNFVASLDQAKINRLHFMGGEPLLSKRFRQIIDHLIDTGRTDISISFVTNGTILDQKLIDQLKQFRSFDLEISIESIHSNNHYIRQGQGDITAKVIDHINQLKNQQNDRFHLVLRSVPQLLNVNNYDQYILWAWEQQLPIQGIPLTRPAYLAINVLPAKIRQNLIPQYQQVKSVIQNQSNNIKTLTNGRDLGRLDLQLVNECDAIIRMLESPEPENAELLRGQLVHWMTTWDQEFNLDAYKHYPEYQEFFESIGYAV